MGLIRIGFKGRMIIVACTSISQHLMLASARLNRRAPLCINEQSLKSYNIKSGKIQLFVFSGLVFLTSPYVELLFSVISCGL